MTWLRSPLAQIAAHPRWCALVLGIISATGFEPLHLWPLTLLAVAGLIELIARAPGWKQAALTGWLFGVGHFALGNNWIATAFTYQAEMPAWLGWVAVVGLAMFLAIYPALAAFGAWFFRVRPPALVLSFAGLWIVTEWLRSWVFTGFAWNPLGVTLLGDFDARGLAFLAQWSGTYALSGVVVLLAAALRKVSQILAQLAGWPRRTAASGLIGAAGAVALLMLVPFGMQGGVGAIPFTLVQPDIRQSELTNPAGFEKQFSKTASLTLPRHPGERRLVLWPESGIPDYLRSGYPLYFYQDTTYAADPGLARARIARVIGPGSVLLTGAVDLEMRRDSIAGARNAVTVLDDKGQIRASYAKAHLVPGGEYLPLRPLLEPLGATRLVAGSIDFWPGPGPRTLNLGPWGKAGVQICYEIVFSGQVVDRAHRPDYIFNPSNDGWFGSWGPPQHLAQARLRAIEEGLPVLRATTTGISAVIDADGIVRQHLARLTAGRLDGMVPPAHAPTLFARLGNVLPLGWALVLLALSLVASRRRRS
ncbi:MAG TPA: apolipoprotein N-acyltransferase [Novosphingobium sp.]|nr:apolipoprotein N-acyltransferase [Novosphingobium sp.]